MRWKLSDRIDLGNERISPADAVRQMRTAAEILRRLEGQPGVILADQVGMGKTFVALAVAVSVVESTGGDRPVVVDIPASVKEKWPREWEVFSKFCLRNSGDIRAPQRSVNRGADFLKLLDDPLERRNQIVFVTHEALTSSLTDPFIKLALISWALRHGNLEKQRRAFPRWAWSLLRYGHFRDEKVVEGLLQCPPLLWKATFERLAGTELPDDPVPTSIVEALELVDVSPLIATLETIPLFSSANLDERLAGAREGLRSALNGLWKAALTKTHLSFPLLIMDEAHHLKNPYTRLAQLFANPDNDDEGTERGVLGGVFERMLFLTATPFQLSHEEMIQIISRFHGIRWGEGVSHQAFEQSVESLQGRLDHTQASALRLDHAWGRLTAEDLGSCRSVEEWLNPADGVVADGARGLVTCLKDLEASISVTEQELRPWVIRHVRADRDQRRTVLPGCKILPGDQDTHLGLEVGHESVLPFLLAARAQALVAAAGVGALQRVRAYFAEGLASSFEAYRETRQRNVAAVVDEVLQDSEGELPPDTDWYLRHIDSLFQDDRARIWEAHPKIQATVGRARDLWLRGEKVLVFCFYRATGRSLRRHISRAIEEEIIRMGAAQLRLDPADRTAVAQELDKRAQRFFDPDAPITKTAREKIGQLLATEKLTAEEIAKSLEIVVRFLRTPSFLVRYIDLSIGDPRESLDKALDKESSDGLSLHRQITRFRDFAASRVGLEREELFAALDSLQTGSIFESAGIRDDDDEDPGRGVLLPNVRLANGAVKSESRRRMMLCFNTVFFPEILVASSVMAEGVDLHLNCRHLIHHDLDWNPSILEQRTGRLDRIGSKSEAVKQPIVVYEPYIEGTQDEKLFRVVKDRERWFNVVMGQQLELDEWSTERLASRIPLPESLASRLTIKLGLEQADSSEPKA